MHISIKRFAFICTKYTRVQKNRDPGSISICSTSKVGANLHPGVFFCTGFTFLKHHSHSIKYVHRIQIYTRGAKIHQVKMLHMNTALVSYLPRHVFMTFVTDSWFIRSWVTTSGIPERVSNAFE